MVAVIPPLLMLAHGKIAKSVYGFTLAVVILASWMISFVGRDVAIAITIAVPLWFAVTRFVRPTMQLTLPIVAWLAVEGVFLKAASIARKYVIANVNVGGLRDIVLTPAVGNPLCYGALVVEVSGDVYAATTAAVAPFPAIRNSLRCPMPPTVDLRTPGTFELVSLPIAHQPSLEVAWGTQRRDSRAMLVGLVKENCDIRAAMKFVRVPALRDAPNGAIEFSDLRYGEGGFASIITTFTPDKCPRFVPGWTPARLDLLTQP